MAERTTRGTHLVVHFDAERCMHARRCVLELPEVFEEDGDDRRVAPDASHAELVAAQVRRCPSGALRYTRLDGGPEEGPPAANLVRVLENGPLEVRGPLEVEGEVAEVPALRTVLCRCGQSERGARCDGTCQLLGFEATGDPNSVKPRQDLLRRDGPLRLTCSSNGPYLLQGPVEVVSATGRTLARVHKVSLCRCGASQNKPFCDGAHERIGFRADR